MEKGELQQYPLLLTQCRTDPETIPVTVHREFTSHMNALQKESKSGFIDTDDYISKESWVLGPFVAKIEDVQTSSLTSRPNKYFQLGL